jgi:hypothetical protein
MNDKGKFNDLEPDLMNFYFDFIFKLSLVDLNCYYLTKNKSLYAKLDN